MKVTISPQQKFKHASHIAWRHVDREAVLLNLDSSDYYSLDEVGAFIWGRLGAGATYAAILEDICREYDVSASLAKKDLETFIRNLCKEKLAVPV